MHKVGLDLRTEKLKTQLQIEQGSIWLLKKTKLKTMPRILKIKIQW